MIAKIIKTGEIVDVIITPSFHLYDENNIYYRDCLEGKLYTPEELYFDFDKLID